MPPASYHVVTEEIMEMLQGASVIHVTVEKPVISSALTMGNVRRGNVFAMLIKDSRVGFVSFLAVPGGL